MSAGRLGLSGDFACLCDGAPRRGTASRHHVRRVSDQGAPFRSGRYAFAARKVTERTLPARSAGRMPFFRSRSASSSGIPHPEAAR